MDLYASSGSGFSTAAAARSLAIKSAGANLWGWLADAADRRVGLVRATALAGLACWLGLFVSTSFLWISTVVLAAGILQCSGAYGGCGDPGAE